MGFQNWKTLEIRTKCSLPPRAGCRGNTWKTISTRAAGRKGPRPGSALSAKRGEPRLQGEPCRASSCPAPTLHARFSETANRAASQGRRGSGGCKPGSVLGWTARGGAASLRPSQARGGAAGDVSRVVAAPRPISARGAAMEAARRGAPGTPAPLRPWGCREGERGTAPTPGMEAPLARAAAAPRSLPADSESCTRPLRHVPPPGRAQLTAAALPGAPALLTPAAPPAGGM